MAVRAEARQALAALDAALRTRPHADADLFTAATRAVTSFRDGLIAEGRRSGHYDRAGLHVANSVLGMVLAGRFPLGSVPWPEIEKARGWLAEHHRPDPVSRT